MSEGAIRKTMGAREPAVLQALELSVPATRLESPGWSNLGLVTSFLNHVDEFLGCEVIGVVAHHRQRIGEADTGIRDSRCAPKF